MPGDPTLLERLAAQRNDDASLANGNSNHLPMALCALSALGASAAQIERFHCGYRPLLLPLRPRVAAFDPLRDRGKAAAYADWLDHFRSELMRHGRERLLRQQLPQLMTGIAGSAFHGLIRLAYGLRFDCDDELAAGLAMLTAFPLAVPLPEAPGSTGAAEGLRRLAMDTALQGIDFVRPPILGRLAEVMANPVFRAGVPALRADKGPQRAWHSLALAAARLYRATADFSVLHLVTSLHALQLLWPYLEEPEPVIQRFWVAFCAVYVSIGAPWPMAYLDGGPLLDWRELLQIACASQDEHLIKLVDSTRALSLQQDADSELPGVLQQCATLAVARAAANR